MNSGFLQVYFEIYWEYKSKYIFVAQSKRVGDPHSYHITKFSLRTVFFLLKITDFFTTDVHFHILSKIAKTSN